MRNQIIFIFLIFSFNIAVCQNRNNKFKLKTSFAIGGTDNRLFKINEGLTARLTQENSDKLLPSTFFNFGIEYRIIEIGKLYINVGLNYSYEWNNSKRPYDHCIVNGSPCPYIFVMIDGYSYHLIGNSVSWDYIIYDSSKGLIKIGFGISPYIRFLSYYDDGPRTWDTLWKLEYLFTEITPHLSIEKSDFEIGIFTRVWQHRKVDRSIYPKKTGSSFPVLSEDYFNINPWKFGIFVKYDFPFRENKMDL